MPVPSSKSVLQRSAIANVLSQASGRLLNSSRISAGLLR
jgi:hypothetical protein